MAEWGLFPPSVTAVAKIRSLDLSLCHRLNRLGREGGPSVLMFNLISRLGDGCFWYVLMCLLPWLHGRSGARVAVQMGLTALVALWVYRILKARTSRPRPYAVHPLIVKRGTTLDTYSFPSGHTLQATAFTIVLVAHFPLWAWLAVPFTLLVAWSRPMLGLHYPSDVLAGASLGALLALASLGLSPPPSVDLTLS